MCYHFNILLLLYCRAAKLWGKANTRLQGISLKVPEQDVELNQVHSTYLGTTDCVCRVTRVGGTNMSDRLKNPHEDWLLGYDALVSDDASMLFN